MTPEQRTDLLAVIAARYITVVHSDEPEKAHRWLAEAMRDAAAAMNRPRDLATVTDWMGLATLLAAAASPAVPFERAVAWVLDPEPPKNPWLVDDVAVARACDGQQVRLTGTERRKAVEVLTGRGMSVPQIARQLHTTERTVERHREALRRRGNEEDAA